MPTRASAASSSSWTSLTPSTRLGLAAGLGGRERQRQVVDGRQQLAREPGDAAALGRAQLLGRPLAEVLEVGLRPLRQREVLVALAGPGRQLVEVVLDLLGLLLGRGGQVGLGDRRVGGRRAWRRRSPAPSAGGAAAPVSGAASFAGSGVRASSSSRITCPRRRPRRRRPPPRRPRRHPPPAPLGLASAACCCWAFSYICSETLWNAVCSASAFALISATSSDSRTSRTSLIACSISSFDDASTPSPEVLELALGLVGRVLRAVAGLGQLALALVLVGVGLGVGDHVA